MLIGTKIHGILQSMSPAKSSILILIALIVLFTLALVQTAWTTDPDESTLAEDTQKILEEALTREYGHPITGKISYERHQSIVHVIAIDFQLEPGELDTGWAEKVIQALRAAGATDPKIAMWSDWGPVEVTAEGLSVGDNKASSVQFTILEDDSLIVTSIDFPEMSETPFQ